jgi:hypothetical protein
VSCCCIVSDNLFRKVKLNYVFINHCLVRALRPRRPPLGFRSHSDIIALCFRVLQVDVCLPLSTGLMQAVVEGDVVVTGAVALQVDVVEPGSAPVPTAARWQRMAMMQVRMIIILTIAASAAGPAALVWHFSLLDHLHLCCLQAMPLLAAEAVDVVRAVDVVAVDVVAAAMTATALPAGSLTGMMALAGGECCYCCCCCCRAVLLLTCMPKQLAAHCLQKGWCVAKYNFSRLVCFCFLPAAMRMRSAAEAAVATGELQMAGAVIGLATCGSNPVGSPLTHAHPLHCSALQPECRS